MATEPPPNPVTSVVDPVEPPVIKVAAQVLPVTKQSVIIPFILSLELCFDPSWNPVEFTLPENPPDIANEHPAPLYPVVVKLPEPICACILDVPLVITLLKVNVIRFAHNGMPVNNIVTPDVEFCAVPKTILDDTP